MRYQPLENTSPIDGSLTARVHSIPGWAFSHIVDMLSSVNTSVLHDLRHDLPEFVVACKPADDILNAREEVRIVARMLS
jgi:hypothetical protein